MLVFGASSVILSGFQACLAPAEGILGHIGPVLLGLLAPFEHPVERRDQPMMFHPFPRAFFHV